MLMLVVKEPAFGREQVFFWLFSCYFFH